MKIKHTPNKYDKYSSITDRTVSFDRRMSAFEFLKETVFGKSY